MNKIQKIVSLALLTVSAHAFAANFPANNEIVPANVAGATLVSVASQEVVTAEQMLQLAKQARIAQEEQERVNAEQAARTAELERQLKLSTFERVVENYVTGPVARAASSAAVGVSKAGTIVVEGVKAPLVVTGAAAIGVSLWNASHNFYEDQIKETGKFLVAGAVVGTVYSFFSTRKVLADTAKAEQDKSDFKAAKKELRILAQQSAQTATTHGELVAIEERLKQVTGVLTTGNEQLGTINSNIVTAREELAGLRSDQTAIAGDVEVLRAEGQVIMFDRVLTRLETFLSKANTLSRDFFEINKLEQGSNELELRALTFYADYQTVIAFNDTLRGFKVDLLKYPALMKQSHTLEKVFANVQAVHTALSRLDIQKVILPAVSAYEQRLQLEGQQARLELQTGFAAAAADDVKSAKDEAASARQLPLFTSFSLANRFGIRPTSPTHSRSTSPTLLSSTGGNVSEEELD